MPPAHLTTCDIYAAQVNGHTAPIAVIDTLHTYRQARFANPGDPAFIVDDSPSGQALIAVFRLSENPFTHPDVYVRDHGHELHAVTLEAALARRSALNQLITVTLAAPDAITSRWDERPRTATDLPDVP